VTSAHGIFFGAVTTDVFGFITTLLFLFCTPDLETLFNLSAPQPFIQIYALALGKKSSAFMTSLAALEFLVVCELHPL
jgi:translation initiation factor 5B